MSDEGFHEIQLNGKQLVFLFMAATVVSVVIFLCGVMVGRGVRVPPTEIAAVTPDPLVDPTAPVQTSPTTGATSSDRVPLSAQETLTYAERLEAPDPPDETLKAPAPPRETAPRETAPRETAPRETVPRDAAPPAQPPAGAAVASAGFSEPAGDGWVVQVMATATRPEAESLARRLSSKGYPAFVSNGDGRVPRAQFRVRVGKFNDRREANAVASRLQKEEQFTNTWLTR